MGWAPSASAGHWGLVPGGFWPGPEIQRPAHPEVVARKAPSWHRLEESGVTCGRGSRARGRRGAPQAFALPTAPSCQPWQTGCSCIYFFLHLPVKNLRGAGRAQAAEPENRTAVLMIPLDACASRLNLITPRWSPEMESLGCTFKSGTFSLSCLFDESSISSRSCCNYPG